MISDFYFFDQFSHTSHIGRIHRSKRNLKDLNQALFYVKIALSINNDQSDKTEFIKSNSIKQQTDENCLQKPKTPIIPEYLTKELDIFLQIFNEKSPRSTSPQPLIINNEQEIDSIINQPKIFLPSSLILELHSTWSDLIKNADYKYKIWRTKSSEESWRQYVQQKRSEQINPNKKQSSNNNKPINHRRTSSRTSVTSLTNTSHRQSITANSKIRLNRSPSRTSFLSSSYIFQDNRRLLKTTSENVMEPIKNGIHIEFKLSTQIDEIKQINEQKIVSFDVPKLEFNFDEDFIKLTQNKCKQLLAETKQKILAINDNQNRKQSKICQILFYEDNQHNRKKNSLLTSNEFNQRQKSKFALAILRHEIPEKYNIDFNISSTKHKCYIELTDGSSQIYYPSGRLAVLRLRTPNSTTLFFDDIDSSSKQFLGLITSTGNVILMQPTFHARFITDSQEKYAYLCNGKTGIIEKQIQSYSTQRKSISNNDDNNNSSLFENTIQLQLNSFMQLEYHNKSNINFAFTCQNQEFKFQLGIHLPKFKDLTKAILTTKRLSRDKILQINSNLLQNQQILSNEQINFHQLPMMQDLGLLRKRIKYICHNWLKEIRTSLGVLDIDAYCLTDLSTQSILTETKQETDNTTRSKSAKQLKTISILTKRTPFNNNFTNSMDKQQFLRTQKSESNIISNVIEQFVPHSDAGRIIKQRICAKKNFLSTPLPIIK